MSAVAAASKDADRQFIAKEVADEAAALREAKHGHAQAKRKLAEAKRAFQAARQEMYESPRLSLSLGANVPAGLPAFVRACWPLKVVLFLCCGAVPRRERAQRHEQEQERRVQLEQEKFAAAKKQAKAQLAQASERQQREQAARRKDEERVRKAREDAERKAREARDAEKSLRMQAEQKAREAKELAAAALKLHNENVSRMAALDSAADARRADSSSPAAAAAAATPLVHKKERKGRGRARGRGGAQRTRRPTQPTGPDDWGVKRAKERAKERRKVERNAGRRRGGGGAGGERDGGESAAGTEYSEDVGDGWRGPHEIRHEETAEEERAKYEARGQGTGTSSPEMLVLPPISVG